MTDKDYLQRAVELAKKSPEEVQCACLIVQGTRVVTSQFNSQKHDNMAINHAEIKAIVAANYDLRSRVIERATAYCSCEPCAMCLTALSYAKIERIVYNKTMKELSGDDPQGDFDSQAFIQTLNFVPKLEQLTV